MIRFENVTKTYRGNARPGLSDVGFEVARGEFVFLVGASGSGKSTCLRLILREDVPSAGRVVVLGRDTRTLASRKVPYFRRHIGAVFQDFRLLPSKTVFQNVAFTLQVTGSSRGFVQQAVPEALALVGLSGKEKRLPHELSGGEQQRVAIARAIVNRPQVLLADEPTGNLDPATSIEIMQLFARINQSGTTLIMATHEAGFVDQMQRRVIELSGGEVVRDENQSGYGDTSQLPTLEPIRQKGADAIAALTAVLELRQQMTDGSTPGHPEPAAAPRVEVADVAAAPDAAPIPDDARRDVRATATAEAQQVAPAPEAPVAEPPEPVMGEPVVDAPVPDAPVRRSLTGPIEIELPDLPEVGVADRLGLVDSADDDAVGPTS